MRTIPGLGATALAAVLVTAVPTAPASAGCAAWPTRPATNVAWPPDHRDDRG